MQGKKVKMKKAAKLPRVIVRRTVANAECEGAAK